MRNMMGRKKKRSFDHIFQDHIHASMECAEELLELFTDFTTAEEHFQKIIELEHVADRLVGETYELLDQTFISHYDKPDIEQMITRLDNLLDFMKKSAVSLQVYRIVTLRPEAVEFAKIITAMCADLKQAIESIGSLKMETLEPYIFHVKELEEKADSLANRAMQHLFDEENDPKTVLKWKAIFEQLETVTDQAEHVINIVSSIVRKKSV